jgi:Ankyrin repeat
MTPLHYAADSALTIEPRVAAECVQFLLEVGHADPCILDDRRRVPYFLASHDAVRDAFRIARATLGEEYCLWDEKAKVGPPLTQHALDEKNEKEAEKRRKKRAKQKEKKVKEKAEAKEAEERKLEAEERQRQEEEAKRCRDGLKPKSGGGGACDFCQVVCVGRKRAQMLKRLEYAYCCSECVQKHKRELMAAAATARLSG